jgi:hypothetical protein
MIKQVKYSSVKHFLEDLHPAYDDYSVSLLNIKAPALNPPTYSIYRGCELPSFSGGATEILYFQAQLPHSWAEGDFGDIEFHFHTAYPNANAGNSVWTFTFSWANVLGTFPIETSITKTFASSGVSDSHIIHDFGEVASTGKLISSVLLCSLSRIGGDVADTYGSGIFGVSADFHINKDSLGSYEKYVK